MVHPATDGTTYVVVGSAGRPCYSWGGPVEDDRNFDVVPAPPGGTTTMSLRAINQQGVEFDRVVFSRTAKRHD